MASPVSRSEILDRLRRQIRDGKPIIGAGAGIGLSAKAAEAGGIDLIIVYNSGRFRMAGCGSLAGLMPYSNANATVEEMAAEVLGAVRRTTPVIAGVCGTDPFTDGPRFLARLTALGYAGIQNFPTVGLIDGQFRAHLEETGMGYGREVALVRHAAARGLLTTPYVFTPADAAVRRRPDILVLCHGGPVATPADARFVLERVRGLHGFYGASAMERLPVERAIQETTAQFKSLALPS
ncbi:phosphoenolpyruvate hydrolase family protein [Aspergillus brunneoviolaceus CBS 621.78]|uniref:Uncharacterized protein n=1 Tax=Aspergillus brunneoviolaceus CBS 621.78 TaxID=1450534 RepID=A0ACD1GLD3_9EURO|nr:hypothetical protein BO95DRAFT_479205 [Aspergillus brunneoviolaceus CBS 621.78]RAH49942.1 hypothetical protein BO95DRAFT_479205 [Aspergillus brunneoviolaceus CBS 621.78]